MDSISDLIRRLEQTGKALADRARAEGREDLVERLSALGSELETIRYRLREEP